MSAVPRLTVPVAFDVRDVAAYLDAGILPAGVLESAARALSGLSAAEVREVERRWRAEAKRADPKGWGSDAEGDAVAALSLDLEML